MVVTKMKTVSITIALFIIVELFIVMGWFKGCNYSARKVIDENTDNIRIVNPVIDVITNTKDANSIIIRDGSNEYLLFWEGAFARAHQLNSSQLADLLSCERELFVQTKKGTNKVCYISSDSTTYLSIDEYNDFQKKQCIFGTIMLSVFELIFVCIFVIALLAVIR